MTKKLARTRYLEGLALGPMGSWLAAVGLLSALSRQASVSEQPNLSWDNGYPFIWGGRWDDLVEWLATEYRPVPVVTPWQSGGGWGEKDKSPVRRLTAIKGSDNPRLAALRDAIIIADQVMETLPPGADKGRMVRALRAKLPDSALPWLDVAVPLEADGLIGWTPISGTGGNDGRWDISTTYHECVLQVMGNADRARGWAYDLLAGTNDTRLLDMSAGPYWPAMTEQEVVNPWAIILTVEGLCVWGHGRLLEHNVRGQRWTTRTIMPGPNGGSVHDEAGWGEVWLPVWDQPMTIAEVGMVLGRGWPRLGRATWQPVGTHARHPAEMLLACRTGGAPLGVSRVLRYAMARRRGLNHMATLLEQVAVI